MTITMLCFFAVENKVQSVLILQDFHGVKLVLHDEFFLTCVAMLETIIHCKLQQTRYTAVSRTATCNNLKKLALQLCFLQSSQARKSCEKSS